VDAIAGENVAATTVPAATVIPAAIRRGVHLATA